MNDNDIPVKHIVNTDQITNLTGRFTIRKIEELTQNNDLEEGLHRHDFYLILFISKGSGFHEIDFVNYTINDFSVFLLKPGQIHKLNLKQGSKGFLVQFDKEFSFSGNILSQLLLRKVSHLNLCQLNSLNFDKLNVILINIFEEYTCKYEDYTDVVKAYLNIYFIELIRHRNSNIEGPKEANQYKQQKLEKFLDLIEDNIVKHKQVSKYAEMLNLTVYQLNAITKVSLKKNASDVINEYIILESKRNLLATTQLVSQIAYNLGFEDTSYFIRFFKKHTGYTPENFRQQIN